MTTVEKTSLKERLSGIEERLREVCERHRVPGAALAVRSGDELVECATGVLNKNTGVEATTDSLFQIGSITKLFTTTLVMQLADEGRLNIDDAVRKYLPEFHLKDDVQAAAITIRQLLNHTSGIDGDFFLDTGRGSDCVERYVLALSAVPSLHPAGEMWSYCNAGFSVAGRIIEKLTGLTWDDALKQRLLRPAGIRAMGTLPEEALLGRAAAGHMPGPDGVPETASVWSLARSNGPAGATPFAPPRALLTFGWMHLAGGTAEGGERLLSEEAVREMQKPQVALPGADEPHNWGLGWMLFDWGGERVIGHDGGTIGQSAFFRIAPEQRFGAALLTNGGNTQAAYRKIFGEVFERGAGITMTPLPEANPNLAIDPARFVGTYEKLSARVEVREEDGRLVAESTQLGFLPGTQVFDLLPIDDSNLSATARQTSFRSTITFLQPGADRRFAYLRQGRLHRRV